MVSKSVLLIFGNGLALARTVGDVYGESQILNFRSHIFEELMHSVYPIIAVYVILELLSSICQADALLVVSKSVLLIFGNGLTPRTVGGVTENVKFTDFQAIFRKLMRLYIIIITFMIAISDIELYRPSIRQCTLEDEMSKFY
ncbi:hypothetical protein NPIL_56401 [Nephila pilipes]|uniref:Uncharacterized protein n=1 Tax=Nephila pilipes TaxID=299642 RepID=A0A8X6NZ06_NEPPI|nr:hypothetical protein NPIL_56401 [Nephila pilipes]